MPTVDRTTVRAAFDAWLTMLRANLVADPPTAMKPFRRIETGDVANDSYARPFMTVYVDRLRMAGVIDDDRLIEVTLGMRIVSETTARDTADAIFDVVGAVDDYLDSLRDVLVVDGAKGFDNRAWSMDYPRQSSGSRVVTATSKSIMVVNVERLQNRLPA